MSDTAMHAAASFAAVEAIRAGEWDGFLNTVGCAVRDRKQIINPGKTPTVPLPAGQIWTWQQTQWEPRGTGALG